MTAPVPVTDEQAGLINAVYRERDQLVAALSKLFPAHLALHDGADWEDDWRNIVCVHLPAGQATWHIHDSELPLFGHLVHTAGHWDGHSTEEKYARLNALEPHDAARPSGFVKFDGDVRPEQLDAIRRALIDETTA